MSFNQKSFNLPYEIIYIHYDVIAYHIIYHLYIIELIKRTKGKKKVWFYEYFKFTILIKKLNFVLSTLAIAIYTYEKFIRD